MTDADLLLGYLTDGALLGGQVRLSRDAAETTLATLGAPLGMSALATADGVVKVADAQMARALRVVSVERGIDPRELALVAFGGAGGMHACALAEELGCRRILLPLAGGVLSALGLAIGDLRRDYVQPAIGPLGTVDLSRPLATLAARAEADLPGATHRRFADCRYAGQSHELTVPVAVAAEPSAHLSAAAEPSADLAAGVRAAFDALHERRYGYALPGDEVEMIAVRLVATVGTERPRIQAPDADPDARAQRRPIWLDGDWREVEIVPRAALGPGARLAGPAVVEFAEATCLLRPGWSGRIDPVGTLVLER